MKKLSDIVIDETIYPRAAFDPDTVERYREAMAAGAIFPPIVITQDNRLLDGRHRLEANKLVGAEDIEVTIEDPADPAARAVELNLHGKPLTRGEMKELARKWYGTRPVKEIATVLGVTRQTVQNWVSDLAAQREAAREEIREKALELRGEGLTQEEVAAQLGIDRTAISKWENKPCESVKNLTPAHLNQNATDICLTQEFNNDNPGEAMPMVATRAEAQKNLDDWARGKGLQSAGEKEQVNDFPERDTGNDMDLISALIGCRIETHYGTGGVVANVIGSQDNGFYTLNYKKNPRDRNFGTINSITVKNGVVLCEDFPLKIMDLETEDNESDPSQNFKREETPEQVINDYGGREAAESFRKKVLPYSDEIKEFYYQLKKASDLAEQLITRREDMIEAIADMHSDGVSVTILANAVIQACDIYIPRFIEVKETLQEVIKPGIKGVAAKDKFMVLTGGKTNGN